MFNFSTLHKFVLINPESNRLKTSSTAITPSMYFAPFERSLSFSLSSVSNMFSPQYLTIILWNVVDIKHSVLVHILWNSMTSTSFVFTELANTMKYVRGFSYNLVFTEWRHCASQNKVWGRGCYITLFSPSDVTAFHRYMINMINVDIEEMIDRTKNFWGWYLWAMEKVKDSFLFSN